jgi:hypothetical protein
MMKGRLMISCLQANPPSFSDLAFLAASSIECNGTQPSACLSLCALDGAGADAKQVSIDRSILGHPGERRPYRLLPTQKQLTLMLHEPKL